MPQVIKISEKCLKTAENDKNRRIQPKYREDSFENGFSAFLVRENSGIATKILTLSAIGTKLASPATSSGGHLGFWALDPPGDSFFSCRHFFFEIV